MGQRIQLLSYNIQAGIQTTRYRHYITRSWKHVLPHAQRFSNLDRVAHQIGDNPVAEDGDAFSKLLFHPKTSCEVDGLLYQGRRLPR